MQVTGNAGAVSEKLLQGDRAVGSIHLRCEIGQGLFERGAPRERALFDKCLATRVAVMLLVQEPMWNLSLIVTGVSSPTRRTPDPADSGERIRGDDRSGERGHVVFLRIGPRSSLMFRAWEAANGSGAATAGAAVAVREVAGSEPQ